MSKNETVIMLEQSIDPIRTETVAQSDHEAADITYQRADGTVERAHSVADAIARCPVLGKLAIEAPDQANILLELAAVGREKMVAIAKEEPHKPQHEKKVEAKPQDTKTEKLPLSVVAVTENRALTRQFDTGSEHRNEPRAVPAAISETLRLENRTDEAPAIAESREEETTILSDVRTEDIVRHTHTVDGISESVVAKPPLVENAPKTSIKSSALAGTIADVAVEPKKDIGPAVAIIRAATHEVNVTTDLTHDSHDGGVIDGGPLPIDGAYDTGTPEVSSSLPIISRDAITHDSRDDMSRGLSTDTREALALFDAETVDTYYELEAMTVVPEQNETKVSEGTEQQTDAFEERVKAMPDAPYTSFEAFIDALDTAEETVTEPVTLETIKENATETLVEQSFVSLVKYLAEPLDCLEKNTLLEVVRQVETELPSCYTASEAGPPQIHITPEMTDSLLNLLRNLGYSHPGDTLVDLASRCGNTLLFDALEYICDRTRDDRLEFLMASVTTTVDEEDATKLRLRLGKVLFGLIARRSHYYSLSV